MLRQLARRSQRGKVVKASRYAAKVESMRSLRKLKAARFVFAMGVLVLVTMWRAGTAPASPTEAGALSSAAPGALAASGSAGDMGFSAAPSPVHGGGRHLLSGGATCDNYDPDSLAFGWVIFYVLVLLHALVGLAIICDDRFVASLEKISEVLDLSEDVAGATFLAAGSSAPELFTSTVDVFFAQSNVGIGTIVGSAVFNILVIIAMSATASSVRLKIDWKPLTRDCIFYSFSIGLMIQVFSDGDVFWYEALWLVLLYGAYVAFMYKNEPILAWVGRKFDKEDEEVEGEATEHRSEAEAAAAAIAAYEEGHRHSVAYASAATDGSVDEEAIKLRVDTGSAIVRRRFRAAVQAVIIVHCELPRLLAELRERRRLWEDACLSIPPHTRHSLGFIKFRAAVHVVILSRSFLPKMAERMSERRDGDAREHYTLAFYEEAARRVLDRDRAEMEAKAAAEAAAAAGSGHRGPRPLQVAGADEEEGEGGKSVADRVYDIVSWPWNKAFEYTVPDCAEEEWEKWYPLTFFLSILWIGGLSMLLVEMAQRTGCAVGLNPVVMGLTVLAAGTSIPDALGSMVVARDGMGNMAVANAIGSNVFDVCLGIGLPYLVKTGITHPGTSIVVTKGNVLEPIIVLFATLAAVYGGFAVNNWWLSKKFGYCLLFLYGCFVIYSLATGST